MPVAGRTAIIVDDGIVTGATVCAAILGTRQRQPGKLVLAVPVAPRLTLDRLGGEVDDVLCVEMAEFFHAMGARCLDFTQTTDEEVVRILEEAVRFVRTDPTAQIADEANKR